MAKSLVDYIFRWLNVTFPDGYFKGASGGYSQSEARVLWRSGDAEPKRVDDQFEHFTEDAPACDVCGSITVRNGACYRCYNCGSSMGCS
jgi:ribonucleoside-diphosphate reductase alpha chain